MLYPINPCSFVMIHGNELRQIHLITGAPRCVNPSLIKLLGVCLYMGRIYALLIVKISMHMFGNPWYFVIHMGMDWLRHGVNPSLICYMCIYIHMGRIYTFLVKYQSDRVLLFNEKYVNQSSDVGRHSSKGVHYYQIAREARAKNRPRPLSIENPRPFCVNDVAG